jgi:endonuclease/exonuclease/phosphatase family metal-dependent hydrolase
VTVLRHTTIAEANDGRYASDHLPVMAEVVLD